MENQTENKPVEQKEATVPQQQAAIQEPEETPQQIDWRKFKEARKLERQQKEAAEREAAQSKAQVEALKAAMEAVVNKPTSETTEEEEDKIRKKIDDLLEQRERKREQEKAAREVAELPSKLNTVHPDFQNICTAENLDYLEYHYPEVAAAYKNQPDTFEKWSHLYKAIKRFIPNTDAKKDVAKAEKNLNKPQAMAIPGKTASSDSAPTMLDDARKMENWKRMQRTMKGINN